MSRELGDRLPRILGPHALRHLWAYSYDPQHGGVNVHADEAAVNLNLWLAPAEANLDPAGGGLVVYTVRPPADWPFEAYNTLGEGGAAAELLEQSGRRNVTVPYRANRLVMFDSALFHRTDDFTFAAGYCNRRINLTLLYGRMAPGPPAGGPGPAGGGPEGARACGAGGGGDGPGPSLR
jgi:hypothetical protein